MQEQRVVASDHAVPVPRISSSQHRHRLHAAAYINLPLRPPLHSQNPPAAPSLPAETAKTAYPETQNAVGGQSQPSSFSCPPVAGLLVAQADVSSGQARRGVIGAKGKECCSPCRPELLILASGEGRGRYGGSFCGSAGEGPEELIGQR
ncbi:hypothetical protein V492_01705 [Pseudogymnoascus sp. VKM F-4246]|nr:hypothetical protein V492_01705 [Pseudogymnoascus sp. VKM F-4246]